MKIKKIEIVVRPEKLDDVVEVLDKVGVSGITITKVEGHGRQKGIVEQFRGKEFRVKFIPKAKLEVVIEADIVDKVVDLVTKAAQTGQIGDGKIFVSDIDDVVRIRTKERGAKAV